MFADRDNNRSEDQAGAARHSARKRAESSGPLPGENSGVRAREQSAEAVGVKRAGKAGRSEGPEGTAPRDQPSDFGHRGGPCSDDIAIFVFSPRAAERVKGSVFAGMERQRSMRGWWNDFQLVDWRFLLPWAPTPARE